MTLNAIIAHDDRYGIGKNGNLPWQHNSADMKWFRECTNGHVVVMGRKTWESIGSKRLSNRINVVVSSQEFPDPKDGGPDHVLTEDLTSGLKVLLPELYPHLKIWIIGGANIYGQFLHLCDNIYVTRFEGDYDCDTIVPMNRHLIGYCEVAKKKQEGLTFSIWRKL